MDGLEEVRFDEVVTNITGGSKNGFKVRWRRWVWEMWVY
jgi:hypothetical protein